MCLIIFFFIEKLEKRKVVKKNNYKLYRLSHNKKNAMLDIHICRIFTISIVHILFKFSVQNRT